MITRITIDSEDTIIITRNSIRYEGAREKWTVKDVSPSFEQMFDNLISEIEKLISINQEQDGEMTVFTLKHDDGKKERYTTILAEEEYANCFTIIDKMIRDGRAHD